MSDREWVRHCERCGNRYEYTDRAWRCTCGGILTLPQTKCFSDPVAGAGMWRYARNLLPTIESDCTTLGEGATPLVCFATIADSLVYAKLEFLAPTGSFKDRGAAVAVTRLRNIGVNAVVEDSSGNAGISLAAYCAAADIRCTIFSSAPPNSIRLTQAKTYGAEVVSVSGDRAAATDAALSTAARSYYAGHAWDPFFIEGVKTIAYEIAEQLPDQTARVIFPLGQGTLLLGLVKGFHELIARGRLRNAPELIAVQSDACAPIYAMFREQLTELPKLSRPSQVLAEGIAVAQPVRWRGVLDALRGGDANVTCVSEAAIPTALRRLGRHGWYVEPTSAVVLAALDELITAHDGPLVGPTVLILTASGLKTSPVVSALDDMSSSTNGSASTVHT
jgi:threonine synthase